MYKARYSDSEKQEILKERNTTGISVREICEKYGITVQTFYAWRTRLSIPLPTFNSEPGMKLKSELPNPIEEENKTLRRLYINLSEHNYQLAKFLEK